MATTLISATETLFEGGGLPERMERRPFLKALCTVAAAGTIAGCLDDGDNEDGGDGDNDTDGDDESNVSPDDGGDGTEEKTDAEENAGNDTDGADDPDDGTSNDTDDGGDLNETGGNDTDGNGSDSNGSDPNESDEDTGDERIDENESGGSDGNETDDGGGAENDTESGGVSEDGEDNPDDVTDVTIETAGTDCAGGESGGSGNVAVEGDGENGGGESGGGGVDEAAIEPTDEGAAIRGMIGSPTPCYEARVVEREVAGDELRLLIGVESDGSDLCTECVGAVEYEATVIGAVERIVVEHERIEADPVEVAEADLES